MFYKSINIHLCVLAIDNENIQLYNVEKTYKCMSFERVSL